MKKLYLINPFNPLVSVVKSKANRWNSYTVWKPLGLLVIAGMTPSDWETVIIDENVDCPDYSTLPAPDLVGITAFTSQVDRAYTLSKQFKQQGIPVIMGGIHVTMCPDEAAGQVDSIVTGEAESIWQTVLDDYSNGSLKSHYHGTQLTLDKVPIARHDLLPSGYRISSLQTTRGCPLNCSFCSVTAFNGRHYRHRPIPQVVEEFRMIKEKIVLIVDDNFIGTRKDHIIRTKQLLQAIIDAGIRKKWIAQTTINFGDDEELLSLAAKSGCMGVFIGFESVSTEGLKEINKKFNIRKDQELKSSIRRIHRYGISVVGAFILGLDVDKEGIGESIAAKAQHLGVDALNVMVLTPLPGTRLWDEMKSAGRIILNSFPQDWKYYTLTFPVAQFNHLTWDDMLLEKEKCYRRFYSFPKIFNRLFANIRQLRNPFVTFLSNLWYRANTLRVDRLAYVEFDKTPGEITMQAKGTRKY